MTYALRKKPRRELYWVINERTGEKYSLDPIPLERARAQLKALYAREGGYPKR